MCHLQFRRHGFVLIELIGVDLFKIDADRAAAAAAVADDDDDDDDSRTIFAQAQ